jgi:hypothetical protein
MQDFTIAVNRNASLSIREAGRDRTPVILIDEFAESTAGLIDQACAADYGPDPTSLYPGRRAKLPRGYVRTVLDAVFPLLCRVYAVPADLAMRPVHTVFSLITTPESELEPRQCAPHFDSTAAYYLAVLHYLNASPHCDTGLFRHRATGLERIGEADLDRYLQAREAHLERHGPPPRAYIRGSNEQFELYDRIAYRPNRLVIYPGSLLHSGLVDPAVDIDANPRSGRLTANIFVDFEPAPARH